MRVDAKILIIGCGISGITAAHRLVNAGFHHVRILEATARSGGRIKTGKLGELLCSSGFITTLTAVSLQLVSSTTFPLIRE